MTKSNQDFRSFGVEENRKIRPEECNQSLFPLADSRRSDLFPVIFAKEIVDAIKRHGDSNQNHEVCGVLVGDLFSDDKGHYLSIKFSIEGKHASHNLSQVTFTPKTWEHIQSTMDLHYVSHKIVGWYHTHPGFGIFLSRMDCFIHENFFNLPWQVAYVYDPISKADGLFVWNSDKLEQQKYLVPEDSQSIRRESKHVDWKSARRSMLLNDVSGESKLPQIKKNKLSITGMHKKIMSAATDFTSFIRSKLPKNSNASDD